MKIWKYSLGQWIKDGYELLDWTDETQEFEDFLKANGFDPSPSFSWGKEYDEHIIFYPLLEDETSWLADIPTMNSSFYFYIPDHPSFLMFKKEYKNIYVRNHQKFIETQYGEFHNIDLISQISICANSSSEYLNFYDKQGEFKDNIEFSLYEAKNGKKFGGKAREWLKENLGIE